MKEKKAVNKSKNNYKYKKGNNKNKKTTKKVVTNKTKTNPITTKVPETNKDASSLTKETKKTEEIKTITKEVTKPAEITKIEKKKTTEPKKVTSKKVEPKKETPTLTKEEPKKVVDKKPNTLENKEIETPKKTELKKETTTLTKEKPIETKKVVDKKSNIIENKEIETPKKTEIKKETITLTKEKPIEIKKVVDKKPNIIENKKIETPKKIKETLLTEEVKTLPKRSSLSLNSKILNTTKETKKEPILNTKEEVRELPKRSARTPKRETNLDETIDFSKERIKEVLSKLDTPKEELPKEPILDTTEDLSIKIEEIKEINKEPIQKEDILSEIDNIFEEETEQNDTTINKKKIDKKIPNKKKKYKLKLAIAFVLIISSLGGLCYASYEIYSSLRDYKKNDEVIEKIHENVTVNEVPEPENNTEEESNIQIVEPDKKVDENSPYWKYIKMNLIDVDFTELKKINEETVGWVQVGGTNINYPFVQTSDNDFYLTHQFDKTKNKGGWLFMDFRNNKTDFDKNTIIYGHNMGNKSMFGTLKNALNYSWYKNTDNHIIKLSTEHANTLWQVFSVYQIPTTNDYIQRLFSSNDEFKTFVDMLQARSAYDFNTEVSPTDKILTLSTCHGSGKKMVMHAKLIKYSER